MANTYTILGSSVVSVATPTITFSNIPATFTDLVLRFSARNDNAFTLSQAMVQFNGNANSVYSETVVQGSPSSAGGGRQTNIGLDYMYINGNTTTANSFSTQEMYIPGYLANRNKTISWIGASENFSNASNSAYIVGNASLYRDTNGISSLTISSPSGRNFMVGSTFYLYGVYSGTGTALPSTPTIGTATDAGTGTSVSVAFTPTSAAGIDASYTVISTPGSITATGTSSPVTVTGLTTGTAYTFQVRANNPGGSSAYSAASNSVTPANPGSYYSIASQTASGSSSITFSSIPQTYKHLELRWYSLTTNAANGVISLRFNSISSANYESYYGYANGGSGTTSGRGSTGQTAINLMSDFSGTGTSSTNSYSGIANINDYTLASRTKSVIHTAGKVGADATNSEISWGGGTINPATSGALAAITQLVIVPLNASTMTGNFELYGIEG